MIWDFSKHAAFDFETSGTLPEYALQPWRLEAGDFWVTSISVIKHDGQKLIPHMSKPYPTVDDMRAYCQWAIDNEITIVTWNGVFDISILIAYGLRDYAMKIKWLDGMLLWKHLEVEPEYDVNRPQKKKYRLKPDAVERFLPGQAKWLEDEEIDFHATDPESIRKRQQYNDRDSVRTLVVASIIWTQMTDRQHNAALIEAECLPMVAESNFRGLPVDRLITGELSASLVNDAKDMLDKLKDHGVTEKVVRSPKQLAKLMFDDWGLPVHHQTATGERSTDKETLHELSFVDPRAKNVRSYREALNNRTKFAETLLKSATYNVDNRTRPAGIVFGTYTGRLTYSSKQGKNKDERQTGFALHQTKRGARFRSTIAAPPGYTLVEFDAAGQEFRWMAIKSGDPAMLQLCMPGEDAHAFMAAKIVGNDYHELMKAAKVDGSVAEQNRYLGKVANLSLQYRTYPKTFCKVARVQYDIPLELQEAQRIWQTYQRTYPKVPDYWDRAIQIVKQQGYAETLAGRRVQVVGNWEGSQSWRMESTALNYPIQGTGAEQKYLAMAVLKPLLQQVGGFFAWDLHDGLYLWIPDAMVDFVIDEGKRLLDNLPYQEAWGFTPPIPMPWDCKAGKLWGQMEKRS